MAATWLPVGASLPLPRRRVRNRSKSGEPGRRGGPPRWLPPRTRRRVRRLTSVWLSLLLATLAVLGAQLGHLLRQADRDGAAVDPVLVQFFGNDFELQERGSFRVREVSLRTSKLEPFGSYLRVTYPRGSASPVSSRTSGSALGGAQFYLHSTTPLSRSAHLRYFLRLPPGFDFVRGGKLPGLYGGQAVPGDLSAAPASPPAGISARMGWAPGGQGELYAYASAAGPTPRSMARGAWSWPTGRWVCVEQEVDVGAPDRTDGRLRVWIDDTLRWEQERLRLRDPAAPALSGIFFSTFFGGGDPSWATRRNQWADFADFEVAKSRIGCSPR